MNTHSTHTAPMPVSIHCGLAPFIASDGSKVGSFQQLNAAGKAIATVTFEDEKVTQFYALAGADRGAFLKAARTMFEGMQAINFLNK